jgi:hypothetical protein
MPVEANALTLKPSRRWIWVKISPTVHVKNVLLDSLAGEAGL